jgi:hypothetical protein
MNHAETIENDKGDIKLVRLIYSHRNSEAWIEFNDLKEPKYPKKDIIWDNDDFIFGKFYKFLIRYKCNKLKDKDEKKYKEVFSILNQDVVSELIDMLELAIEKKWYEFKK